jgi:hypothetical protein
MVRCQETAVPPRQQPLAIVQVGREPPNPEGVDAGCRKLESRAEIPSSFRQMSATIGVFASLSSISPEVIAARSMNNCPRTARRNPLFSLRSAPNVRPPPRSIPPVRSPPAERGHTQAIPRDCAIVPRPIDLDIWLLVPSRCGGPWSAPPRHLLALLWPSGQPLWVASGSAGQSTLWQTRRFDGLLTDRPDGPCLLAKF